MLLAIDAGNTQIVLGCFKEKNCIAQWRIATHPLGTPDELYLKVLLLLEHSGIQLDQINSLIISSVVPAFSLNAKKAFSKKEIQFVDARSQFSFPIAIKDPESVGADRLVNAEAVAYEYQKSSVIIDSGTATTLCAYSQSQGYLGGAIIPGLEVSLETLTQKAARLSSVELIPPPSPIGKNTKEALQSGVSTLLQGLTKKIHVFDPDLTIKGLRRLYEKSRSSLS